MLNDLHSPLTFLATRRSGKARDLLAPGPANDELREILTIAMRVPDHGKLAPWRFVVIEQDHRMSFAALLQDAYRAEKSAPGALR